MKTTGVVPEAFAASISLLSRSEMDDMPTPSGRVKSIQPYRWTTPGADHEGAREQRRCPLGSGGACCRMWAT